MTPAHPPIERSIAGDELFAMGDIGPCELVDGRIVPMTPTGSEHGAIEVRLITALSIFVRQRNLGWVFGGEVGIYTRRRPDSVRGADIAVVSRSRLPDGPGKRFLTVAPELVVEILFPDDRWQEPRQKIDEYFAIGAERAWVVEPDNRAVLVFTSSTVSRRVDEGEELAGEGVLQGFSIRVRELFTDSATE